MGNLKESTDYQTMPFMNFIRAILVCVMLQRANGVLPVSPVRTRERTELLRDPKIYYTTTELACADGYPIQEHTVVTKDGYVLTVHRIPGGQIRAKVPRRQSHYHRIHRKHHPDFDDCVRESLNVSSRGLPVLVVPGFLLASDVWLLQGPGYDLVYLMADKGYDVWMVNVRGSFYSRGHITLSTSDPKFWDFSFHENAVLDVPSIIDYVLKFTKKEKIGWLGFSMGTTMFFAMSSVLPEYREKILGFVGLAPVAFMKQENMDYKRRLVFNFLNRVVEDLQRRKTVHELLPRSNRYLTLGRNYCSKGSRLQDICYDIIGLTTGYRSRLVLRSKLHLYLTHFPTGTSLKTLLHFQQMIYGNNFRPFDYNNAATNMRIYGTATPPAYPIWNITTPVALYYTKNDFYYDVKDIEELLRYLPNVIEVDQLEKFNHVDYLWSYNAKDKVYRKAISALDRFQNGDFHSSNRFYKY